jgi:hypothetical protein
VVMGWAVREPYWAQYLGLKSAADNAVAPAV